MENVWSAEKGKLEEFLQIWDDAAEQQTIDFGRFLCDLVMLWISSALAVLKLKTRRAQKGRERDVKTVPEI